MKHVYCHLCRSIGDTLDLTIWSSSAHNLGQERAVCIPTVSFCGAVFGYAVPPYYGLLSAVKWPSETLSPPPNVCFMGPPVQSKLDHGFAFGALGG